MTVLGVGLDMAWDRASVADLLAYRAVFVCRYLGEDNTGKNLTRAEAEQLSAAGLWIVSNYEYSPGGALKGYAEGVRVARLAAQQHLDCGGGASRPIYFSVDVNVSQAEMNAVADYFRGIASVIGVARTGAYGEYDVIKMLFDLGLITYGWQTYAWSGGRWDDRAQIRQVANGIYVAGHNVDRDENYAADYGQWMIGVSPMSIADEKCIGGNETLPEYLTRVERALWAPGATAAEAADSKLTALATAIANMQPSGAPTDAQVNAGIAKVMNDPGWLAKLCAGVASHIHVS